MDAAQAARGQHLRAYQSAAQASRKDEEERARSLELAREAADGMLVKLAERSDVIAAKRALMSHQAGSASARDVSKEILPYRGTVRLARVDFEPEERKKKAVEASQVRVTTFEAPESAPGKVAAAAAALLSPLPSYGAAASAAAAHLTSPDRFAPQPTVAAGRQLSRAGSAAAFPADQARLGSQLFPPPPPPPVKAPVSVPTPNPAGTDDAPAQSSWLGSPMAVTLPVSPRSEGGVDAPLRLLAHATPSQPVPGGAQSSSGSGGSMGFSVPAMPATCPPPAPWLQGPVLSAAAASPPLPRVARAGYGLRAEGTRGLPSGGATAQLDAGVPSPDRQGAELAPVPYDAVSAAHESHDAFAYAGETGDYSYLSVLPSGRPLMQRALGVTSPASAGRVHGPAGVSLPRSGGREKPPRPALTTPSSTRGEGTEPYSLSPPLGSAHTARGVPAEDFVGPAGMPVSLSPSGPASPLSPRELAMRALAGRLSAQEAAAQRAWILQEAAVRQAAAPSTRADASLYGRVPRGAQSYREVPTPSRRGAGDGVGGGYGYGTPIPVPVPQYEAVGEGDEDDDEDYYDEEEEDAHASGLASWSNLASASAEEVEAGLGRMTPAQLNLFLRTLDPASLSAAQHALARGKSRAGSGMGSTKDVYTPAPAPPAALPLPYAYQDGYLHGTSDDEEEEEEGGGEGSEKENSPGRGAEEEEDSDAEPMSAAQLALFKRTLKAHAGTDALLRAGAATRALDKRQAALLARVGGRQEEWGVTDEGGGEGGSVHFDSTPPLPPRARAGVSSLAMDEYARAALDGTPMGTRAGGGEGYAPDVTPMRPTRGRASGAGWQPGNGGQEGEGEGEAGSAQVAVAESRHRSSTGTPSIPIGAHSQSRGRPPMRLPARSPLRKRTPPRPPTSVAVPQGASELRAGAAQGEQGQGLEDAWSLPARGRGSGSAAATGTGWSGTGPVTQVVNPGKKPAPAAVKRGPSASGPIDERDDAVDLSALLLGRAGTGGQALEAQLARMLEAQYKKAAASSLSFDDDDL